MIAELGPGVTLAGYRIESVIGRGGMGVVYVADDLRLSRRVAIKVIAPGLSADSRFRDRFLREAELTASLDHPHVLPVYGAGETDGLLWTAMRYVEGEDLDALLAREGSLAPQRAVELARQIGEALDAAHARGLRASGRQAGERPGRAGRVGRTLLPHRFRSCAGARGRAARAVLTAPLWDGRLHSAGADRRPLRRRAGRRLLARLRPVRVLSR